MRLDLLAGVMPLDRAGDLERVGVRTVGAGDDQDRAGGHGAGASFPSDPAIIEAGAGNSRGSGACNPWHSHCRPRSSSDMANAIKEPIMVEVTGPDGLRGTIDTSRWPLDGSRKEVLVVLSDGRHLMVPLGLLRHEPGGGCHLPLVADQLAK